MSDETIYKETPTLDEIVFQHRNKEYGAYDLRTKYPHILTKSFILGTLLFLVLALSPFIYMKIQQMNAKKKIEVDSKLVNVLQKDKILEIPKEVKPPPPPPPKDPPKQEVIQNVVPEPKRAPKIETPPPPIQNNWKRQPACNHRKVLKHQLIRHHHHHLPQVNLIQ